MKVDMSSRAVTVRLKRVSQLRRLCLALGKTKPITSEAANFSHREQRDYPRLETDEASPTEVSGHGR